MTKVRDFIGPYRLVRLIRVGQTCEVWEVVKEGAQGRFAMKVVRKEHLDNREEIGQLKHEFEVARGFKHPNVIKLIEFNTEFGIPFLVLELYNALNMKQMLRDGPDRLAHLVPKIVEQSAQALYYLHTEGWIHCDLKPDNILVSEQGQVKLIDFTISQRPKGGLNMGWLLGMRSKIRGTRSYMSPEQIRGKGLDARSDVYSLGCVLYELVGGKPPYTGESPDDLLSKHLKASIPSVQVLNDNVTPEFSDLLRRMMAKKPDRRPATMWDFLKEFRTLRLYRKAPKPPADWKKEEQPDEAS